MRIQHIYITEGPARIQCPVCARVFFVPPEKVPKKNMIKVKCTCNEAFLVKLDYRHKFRKKTMLHGHYQKLPPFFNPEYDDIFRTASTGPHCKVRDLSQHGAGLVVQGEHTLEVGNKIALFFTLDNSARTQLQKVAVIKFIEGNQIGCEFLEQNDPRLGFYALA